MSARLDPAALVLHLVTDTALSAPRTVPEVAAAAVAGGATTVQVREKDAPARELVALLVSVAERVGRQVPVLVDDRADVYLAARAAGAPVAGVHVGQTDLPAGLAREICGPGAVLGLSAATAEELDAAGLAVVSGICADPDPAAAAARYVRAFGRTLPEGALS